MPRCMQVSAAALLSFAPPLTHSQVPQHLCCGPRNTPHTPPLCHTGRVRVRKQGPRWEGGQGCEMGGGGREGKGKGKGVRVWGRWKVVDLNLYSLFYFIINILLFFMLYVGNGWTWMILHGLYCWLWESTVATLLTMDMLHTVYQLSAATTIVVP